MDNKEISLEWFRFANDDLEIAKFICDRRPKPLEIICYHCQQSAEKDLKGYLIYNGEIAPHTHSLPRLQTLCYGVNSKFDEILNECGVLDPFGVAAKYPLEMHISDRDVASSIANAERIKSFIQAIIK